MNEVCSYYFWKWAENDLPGRPGDVQAALLRGEMPPALQKFDARPLMQKLESAAASGRERDEEWEWQVSPTDPLQAARFVFVTCPRINGFERAVRRFSTEFHGLGLSGCDEQSGHVIPTLRPKKNVFLFGQYPKERYYDIAPSDLPAFLRRLDPRRPHPFGIIEDFRGYFVQALAKGRRFIVEWAQNK